MLKISVVVFLALTCFAGSLSAQAADVKDGGDVSALADSFTKSAEASLTSLLGTESKVDDSADAAITAGEKAENGAEAGAEDGDGFVSVNGSILTPSDQATRNSQISALRDGAAVEIANMRKLILAKMARFKRNLKRFKAQLGREALAPMLAQFKAKLNEEIAKYHQKLGYLRQSLQTSQDITAPAPPVALPVPEVVPGAPIGSSTVGGVSFSSIVPLYNYFNERLQDSYYTTDFNVLRTGIREWKYKGIIAFVYKNEEQGTVPLYKFWNLRTGDHRYSTVRAAPAGYIFKGITAYLASTQTEGTVNLMSYFNPESSDTLLTTDFKSVPEGYRLQATEGFVFPPQYVMNPTNAGQTVTRLPTLVPLYRYFNSRAVDHFYTTNWEDLGVANKKDWTYEGIAGMVMSGWEPGTVPLYRFWNLRTLDHFYTINRESIMGTESNATSTTDNNGWSDEGIECFVYPYRQDGTVPLYRYYNAEAKDHFYTTNSGDLGFGKLGYQFQGVSAFIFPAPPQLQNNLPPPTLTFAPVPLYRYYKPTSNDHFYTTRVELPSSEMRGWIPEGVAAAVYTDQVPGTVPLYRYYNPLVKDHLYTTKKFENGKMGFQAEGVECFVRQTPKPGWIPLYRFFNQKVNDHFYTTNAQELTLQADKSYMYKGITGWFYYGIQAYVLPANLPNPGDLQEVFRYYSRVNHEHLYTNVKLPVDQRTFKYEGGRFFVLAQSANGAVPLRHYYNAEFKDHIYSPKTFTKNVNGWVKQKDEGFVHTSPQPGTVPVYMYFNPRVYDHFYTTDRSEIAKGATGYIYKGIGGWRYYGIQFYAFPKSTTTV